MMDENSTISSPNEDEELFYFESDHLALKGNRDYGELLKTLVLLEVQYSKAIQDYEKILALQADALSKPNSFAKRVTDGLDLELPDWQVIVELPNIDWSKYPIELPKEVLQFLNSESVEQKVTSEAPVNIHCNRKSSTTGKKTWSVEEQRRLEELLAIYPPEPIELRRYKKIAAALGNRTVKQVSSRVQKYFLKLYKADLPIPGRIPKNAERARKSKLHVHQRFNHLFLKPTTFFPQLDIPVVMNEREVVPGPSTDVPSFGNMHYDNYLLPNTSARAKSLQLVEETKNNNELQIELLKRVKLEKEKGILNDSTEHIGYKCNYCSEEPIYGTRWHCLVCTSQSIDFCSDCVVGQLYSAEPHPLSHQLQPHSEIADSSSSESSEENGSIENQSISDDISKSIGGSDNEDDDDSVEDNETSNDFEESMDCDHSTDSSITTASKNRKLNNQHLDLKGDQVWNENTFDTNGDSFTDAQNLSYSYLHSNLLLDKD